jgi:hypothetical protein
VLLFKTTHLALNVEIGKAQLSGLYCCYRGACQKKAEKATVSDMSAATVSCEVASGAALQ